MSEELEIPKKSRRGLWIGTGVLAIAALAGSAAHFVRKAAVFDPKNSAVGKALGPELTDYTVELSRNGPSDAARGRVIAGAGAASAEVQKLLEAAESTKKGTHGEAELMQAAYAANHKLRELQQPYFLDGRVIRERTPIFYSFYIEREAIAEAEGYAPERAVFLWRLDTLNVYKSVLGYTHRFAESGLVLLDQTEETLIADFLPALAPDETIELVDEKSRNDNEKWQRDAEERSARITRETFHKGSDNLDTLVELGTLLAQRRRIVAEWSRTLGAQNLRLRPPKRLIPEANYAEDLWIRVSKNSRHRWDEVHDDLQSKRILTAFEAVRDRFADVTARHEIQHRLDAQGTKDCALDAACPALHVPALIQKRTGGVEGELRFGSLPVRVTEEASAYLAQMGDTTLSPKFTLVGLSRFLFDREAWGDTYCYAAMAVLESLAETRGLHDAEAPLVVRGTIQRRHVASLLAVLYALSDDELRSSAQNAWTTLFARPLPKVRYHGEARHAVWRH